MAEDPATNLLNANQTDQDIINPYSVNVPPGVAVNNPIQQESQPNPGKKWKKCICLTCRECTCCIIGAFISILLFVTGLIVFIVAGSKSVSTESIGQPSAVLFVNSSIGSDFIYLKWKPPIKTGGAYITSYTLQYRYIMNNNNNNNMMLSNWTDIFMIDEGLGNNHNSTNLNGSTNYQFRITANNLAGYTGNWSNISLTTKPPKIPQPPSAPFALNINMNKEENNYEFTIAFTTNSNGGSPITQYSVYYGVYSNTTEYKPFCSINASIISQLNQYQYPNCSGIITSSDLSQLFNFRVQSTNSIGSSSYSPPTPCIIPSDNPEYYMCLEIGPPATLTNSAFNLDISSYEIDIKWDDETCADSSAILEYQLQRTDFWEDISTEQWMNVSLPYNGFSKFVQINNLLAGLPYNIRLRSMNKYGWSDWSYLFLQTPETGKCGNIYDTKILRDNCQQFSTQAPLIWIQCNGHGGDSCQTTQFENKWGFSANCTSCWVQLNDCAMGVCTKQCLQDFDPIECETCIMNKCSPETEICSGYPVWPIDCPKN